MDTCELFLQDLDAPSLFQSEDEETLLEHLGESPSSRPRALPFRFEPLAVDGGGIVLVCYTVRIGWEGVWQRLVV